MSAKQQDNALWGSETKRVQSTFYGEFKNIEFKNIAESETGQESIWDKFVRLGLQALQRSYIDTFSG